MKLLTWWFRVVGVVYLALGVTFVPLINSGRVDMLVPGFDGEPGGAAWNGFVDYLFMWGLEEIVLGVFLIAASFRPRWWEPLIWLLVAFSVVRGIGHDMYMLANGYSVVTNVAFVIFHLALIVTGAIFLHRWRQGVGRPGVPARERAGAR